MSFFHVGLIIRQLSMTGLGKLLIAFGSSMLAVTIAQAQLANGGFETNAFPPWTTTGTDTVTGTFSGQAPAEGNFQAVISTPASPGTVLQSPLETFLELNAGTLDGVDNGSQVGGGSAFKQTFTVETGQVISFFWDFLPNGSNSGTAQNDTGFFTLHAAGSPSSTITILATTASSGGSPTGYQQFETGQLAAGSYLLGFAAYDASGDSNPNAQNPDLLIDNVQQISCTDPPANMIGWWPGEGTLHDIVGGFNGSGVGGGPTFATGKVQQAMSFNGLVNGDAVVVPHSPGLDPNPAYSFDAWVYWRGSITNGSSHDGIVVKTQDSGGADSYAMFIYGPEKRLYSIVGAANFFTPINSVPVNEWFHVAQTYDGTTVKVYINGQEAASAPASRSVSSGPLAFATRQGVQHFLNGLLDEIEIFSRELSQPEIEAIYNAGAAGKCGKCAEPPSGLLHWWPADGNTDDIQQGSPGTLHGDATFAAGKVDAAFSLDGSGDYVEVGDADLPVTFTIDAWINPATLGTYVIVGKDGGVADHSYELDMLSDGRLVAYVTNSGNQTTSYVTTAPAVVAGSWQHVAVTYDGDAGADAKMKFYVNGVAAAAAVNSGDTGGAPNDTSLAATIGIRNDGLGSLAFNGLIDEVEMFGSVLTVSEIAAIFNADSTGKCKPHCVQPPSGMLSWWPGNGNASDIQDGHPGTLQNGATFGPGKVGQAFSFDGTDDLVSTDLDVQPSAMPSTTWDAWVYPTRVNFGSGSGSRQDIFSSDDGGFDRGVIIEGGTSTFGVFTGTGVWYPVDVTPNEWQHIAVIYTPTGITFYKNGVEYSFGSAPTGQSTNNRFTIGANPAGGGVEFFQGRIDEVEVFDLALTQAEIQVIYLAGSGGKCRPPLYFANISGRADVGIGPNVAIGGFIIRSDPSTTALRAIRGLTGPPTKTVLIRGIGPSLPFTGTLANPTLELRDTNGALIKANDDWQVPAQNEIEVLATGLEPNDGLEAAIVATLNSDSNYTAILRGKDGGTGIGLVEVYDLEGGSDSHLVNVSTRALVGTGRNVLIGGVIIRGGDASRVVVRAIGPSLPITGKLVDPYLELYDGNALLLQSNDDWGDSPDEAEITAANLDPNEEKESAILYAPAPGNYTAIVTGVGGSTGIGLVEAYNIGPPPPPPSP